MHVEGDGQMYDHVALPQAIRTQVRGEGRGAASSEFQVNVGGASAGVEDEENHLGVDLSGVNLEAGRVKC